MTTPKKPLSKTESAIQLGNILKYAGGRGGGRAKLRKIGEKATKSSKSLTRSNTDLKSKKSGSVTNQDSKLTAKVRATKSTYHLNKGGFKDGKAIHSMKRSSITANQAAKRMKQRGDDSSSLYTSSSGKKMDSSQADARFAGRRKLKSTTNPSPKKK